MLFSIAGYKFQLLDYPMAARYAIRCCWCCRLEWKSVQVHECRLVCSIVASPIACFYSNQVQPNSRVSGDVSVNINHWKQMWGHASVARVPCDDTESSCFTAHAQQTVNNNTKIFFTPLEVIFSFHNFCLLIRASSLSLSFPANFSSSVPNRRRWHPAIRPLD